MSQDELRQELECGICLHTMAQPCTIACGHTFDRACLVRAFAASRCCPVCRKEVSRQLPSINVLMRNLAVKLAPEEVKKRDEDLAKSNEPCCKLCGDKELLATCSGCNQIELCSLCIDTTCYGCYKTFCDHCTANKTVVCAGCVHRRLCLDCASDAELCVDCKGILCEICSEVEPEDRCPGCDGPVCNRCWEQAQPRCGDCDVVIM